MQVPLELLMENEAVHHPLLLLFPAQATAGPFP